MSLEGSLIVGLGSYLPERRVGNDAFEGKTLKKLGYEGEVVKEVVCSDEWITRRTGIKERRYAEEWETPEYMATQAITKALAHASLNKDELGGIITATVTSKHRFPSSACRVQELLGIKTALEREKRSRSFVAYNVEAACAGYVTAIIQANSLLRTGDAHGPLAVAGVEKMTSIVEPDDANIVLFGDGCGASILVPASYAERYRGKLVGRIEATYQTSDSLEGKSKLIFDNSQRKIRMIEGDAVLKLAAYCMAHAVAEIKKQTGWAHDHLLVIAHQANSRIIERTAHVAKLPLEQMFMNIGRYGNMSSATCGVAHDEVFEAGKIQSGNKIILVSFGSGLVTAAVGLDYLVI